MADGLQVIASRLFIPNVGVNARVSGSPSQVFPLSERNVLPLRILVAFGQTEINNEYAVLILLCAPNEEVVWLNISVDDPLFMGLLNSL